LASDEASWLVIVEARISKVPYQSIKPSSRYFLNFPAHFGLHGHSAYVETQEQTSDRLLLTFHLFLCPRNTYPIRRRTVVQHPLLHQSSQGALLRFKNLVAQAIIVSLNLCPAKKTPS
jgi:hypothetical protein